LVAGLDHERGIIAIVIAVIFGRLATPKVDAPSIHLKLHPGITRRLKTKTENEAAHLHLA
jgi:hypothetical protein